MRARRWTGALFAGLLAAAGAAAAAQHRDAPAVDDARIAAVVAAELESIHAATAADLVDGAPARPLVVAGSFVLEHSDGHAIIVELGLAPGAPGNLPVATGIEYLRYTLHVDDGGILSVLERPARPDLVIGVKEELAAEGRAMDAAVAAMTAAKFALPPGRASWRAALRSATYDARLPRERFYGDPSWNFIFEPWDEAHGGWHGVLLDAGLGVEMVDGRAP